MGCPIRKSPDQKLFAFTRGLSQLTTSFISSTYQGIHHTPLVSWLTPFLISLLFLQIDNIFIFILKKFESYFITTIVKKQPQKNTWDLKLKFYVELTGIEPATPRMQIWCSPNWATAPIINIWIRSDSNNVGLGRLELPTPALSERCSNQLSYKPYKNQRNVQVS